MSTSPGHPSTVASGDGRGPVDSATVDASSRTEPATYYGRPVLKAPVWSWEVPAYFFTGGIAGASATLGLGAELAGNERLARSAWGLSMAGMTVSPVLLIADLGRPARFLNMLRMFKVTSPMSVGSWILSGCGATVAVAAARSFLGRPKRLGAVASALAGGLFGPGLVTYTGVLVADTAIPAWHEARHELPIVFAGSATAAAGAAAYLATPGTAAEPARRAAVLGGLVEGLVSQAMESRLGELAQAYREGPARRYNLGARALTAAGVGLLGGFGRRRGAAVAGAAALLGGSLCTRFAVYHAGFNSARDPRATTGPQRERLSARQAGT